MNSKLFFALTMVLASTLGAVAVLLAHPQVSDANADAAPRGDEARQLAGPPVPEFEREALEARVRELENALADERRANQAAVNSIVRLQEERDEARKTLSVAKVPIGAEKPLPFPANTPAAHKPEAFRKISESAAANCGMALSLVETDCSEYPCIAFMKPTGNAAPTKYTMQGCPDWERAYGDLTTVTAIPSADGGMGAIAWMPVPPGDEAEQRIAVFRRTERIRRRLEAIAKAP